MRIPFPERVPINRVALFAVALFIIQQVEGTARYFSVGTLAFIMIAAFAFNYAGGLTRTSGAYVFFYSLLVFIIGVCYKAYLGEPAQSNLSDPKTDILVYVAGITALFATVVISRQISRKSGLLQNFLRDSEMYRASIGCIIFGIAGAGLIVMMGQAAFRVITAFTQLNQLIPLGIIIGVMYEIRHSGGTRSVTLPLLLAIGYVFVNGLFTFSKQGMLLPVVCWFLPVCALRFRLSGIQVVAGAVFVFILFYYLVPYSQYGRKFLEPNQSFSQSLALTTQLLENPEETRKNYEEDTELAGGLDDYYNTRQGFWNRLQFVSVDDALINVTDTKRRFGLSPIPATILNAVPHFLWPGKPDINFGNLYAREIGGDVMDDEDTSTGVSFSATAEAYHMDKWVGVILVAPAVWLVLFVLFDSLFGDLRTTPWGLLVLALLAHTAPEGGLTGLIALMTFGTEALVFCAYFSKWAAPFFAIAVLGPDRGTPRPPLISASAPQVRQQSPGLERPQ